MVVALIPQNLGGRQTSELNASIQNKNYGASSRASGLCRETMSWGRREVK